LNSASEAEGGKIVPANNKYELSIKIHNMFHMKKGAVPQSPAGRRDRV